MDCVFTGLTEEQKQIKALVRDFCKREVDPKRIKAIEEKVFLAKTVEEVRAVYPRDLLRKMHEVGLRQLGIPEKYGGTEPESGGNVTRALAAEEMGYFPGPVAIMLSSAYIGCSLAFASHYITEKQKEGFTSHFMGNPELVLAGTVSEPESGTDPHLPYNEPGVALKVTGRKVGNEWILNGNKMFCSSGAAADVIVTTVRTDKNGPLTESATAFSVPVNTPGVTRQLNKFITVELGGNAQTFFDNVRLPEHFVIGEVNKGYYAAIQPAMAYNWILWTPLLGEIQKVYDDAREYAKQRVQGGKPLIKHSHIAAALGAVAVNIEALRAFTYRVAYETDQWEKVRGTMNTFWSQGYLYLFKKTGSVLVEVANEIYGGIGKSIEMPLEGFARRMFMMASVGSTTAVNAIKCSNDYDDRYRAQS